MPIASSKRIEALRRLASTPPRDLPRAGAASGERPLISLAAELQASGAASDSTGAVGAGFGRGDDADVAALGTVFDAAMDAGLGCLVLDYVAEVCEDPLLTSSDPVEAYLADGACVAAWCRASLASTRALVERASVASLSDVAAAEGLATARTRLAALVPLAETLGRGVGGSDGIEAAGGDDEETEENPPSSSTSTSSEAKKLAQCADVLDWCFAEGAASDSLRGKYASEAEWRVAVSRRRASVAGGGSGDGYGGSGSSSSSAAAAGVKITSTFLDVLRARAAGSSLTGSSIDYPPAPTPRAAAPAIFLSGGSSVSALSAKLDLFAYCLADAGGVASLPSLGARFGSSSAAVARWRLSQLLDEALANCSSSLSFSSSNPASDSNAALDAAVRAVPAAASPDAPYELGKALVALGRPEAALALLRARTKSGFSSVSFGHGGSSSSSSTPFETRLDEALTNLSARLECGLLSEAFTEARAAAARAAPFGSKEHAAAARALTVALARWAADNGELPSVALFPLSQLEERTLLDWLASSEEEGSDRNDAVLQIVLFHLQRGRAPEALLAAAAAQGGKLVKGGSGSAAAAAAEAGALELLRQAARSLPAAQRALVLQLTPGNSASSSSLRLAGPREPAPEGSLRLVGRGLADVVPAATLLSSSSNKGEWAPPPLLLSLTSEAWMERAATAAAAAPSAPADESAQQRQKQQQRPSALRPRTRATTAAATTTTPGWDWKAGGAHPAATSTGGFLAPVAALGTTTTKKARLQAMRL